jgi:hypothetical protein
MIDSLQKDVQWQELGVGLLTRTGRTIAFTFPMGWVVSCCLLILEIFTFGELIHPLSFFAIGPPIALTMTALLFGGVSE